MRKLALALSTAALAVSSAAVAQTAAPARAPRPDVTRADAQAKAEARFAKLDANKDGTIDQGDHAARKAQMFDRIDTDKNGSLSRAEFDAHHANRGDGKARGGHRMGRKGHGGHHGMMAKATGPVTRQAFVDRALGMFDKADANRDGTVTQAERKAVRDTMREQWKARAAQRQQG